MTGRNYPGTSERKLDVPRARHEQVGRQADVSVVRLATVQPEVRRSLAAQRHQELSAQYAFLLASSPTRSR